MTTTILHATTLATALACFLSASAVDYYVDSLGSGDGTSPSSALPSIAAAVNLAGAGDTIWVKGGANRSYAVNSDSDAVVITVDKAGLSLHGYDETPGDNGLASIVISDTYIPDGARANIISNAAANVTIEGLAFSMGPLSTGKQNVARCNVIRNDGSFLTVENCTFLSSKPSAYQGNGTDGIIRCGIVDATNLVVRGCTFRNTRCWDAKHGYIPIMYVRSGTFVDNVFTNVNGTVGVQQKSLVTNKDIGGTTTISFVSNLIYGANGNTGNYAGLFRGTYPGPNLGEIAYNRFIVDRNEHSADNQSASSLIFHVMTLRLTYQMKKTKATEPLPLIHHNTIVGGTAAAFQLDSGTKRQTGFFSNLILLDSGGTVFLEEGTGLPSGQTTAFYGESFFRRNAYIGDLSGGTALDLAGYSLESGLAVSENIVLTTPPEFLNTDNIYDEDFYRYSGGKYPALARGGWTGENGEYPRYIGALEPTPGYTFILFQ